MNRKGLLTVLVHGEVHHLSSALSEWLDDCGQTMTATSLLSSALGTAGPPVHPAMAPYRTRPAQHTRGQSTLT